MVDQQRLEELGRRHGQQRPQHAEQIGPDDQREEGHGRADADGVAGEPRLDQGLHHDVEHDVERRHSDGGTAAVGEQRDQDRRDQPDQEADVGDVVGDEGQHAPGEGQGHADDQQADHVQRGDDESEDGGDDPVPAGSLGEVDQTVRDPGPVRPDGLDALTEAGRVEDHEEDQRGDQGQQGQSTGDGAQRRPGDPGKARQVDRVDGIVEGLIADSEVGQHLQSLPVELGELLGVVGQGLAQPGERPHHRPEHDDDQPIDAEQADDAGQPLRRSPRHQPGSQRVHGDHDGQHQEEWPDDRRPLPQPGGDHEEAGDHQHPEQRRWQVGVAGLLRPLRRVHQVGVRAWRVRLGQSLPGHRVEVLVLGRVPAAARLSVGPTVGAHVRGVGAHVRGVGRRRRRDVVGVLGRMGGHGRCVPQ